MFTLRHTLLAASLLAGMSGVALAQNAATFNPAQLPAIQGTVAEYSLTPRGDVDGLILQDGTQIHLPPGLSTQLVYAVRPGDTVTVHGLKALAVPVVDAMSVTNDATGQTVVDNGPPGLPGPPGPGPGGLGAPGQTLAAQGRIRMDLYGPQGDLNGVILEDGTEIHLPPPEAARLASWLAPGQTIYAEGDGQSSVLGRVIGAQLIGPSQAQAIAVAPPPPWGPPGRRGPGPGQWGAGFPPPPPPGAAAPPPPPGAGAPPAAPAPVQP